MIEPAIQQEPEGIRPRAIWWVGIAVIAISAVLVLIAWWLVVPRSDAQRATAESPLKREPFELANGAAVARAIGERELQRTEWVDREAGTVRIPIDRAIEAVVADPRLIGAPPSPVSRTGAVSRAHRDGMPSAAREVAR